MGDEMEITFDEAMTTAQIRKKIKAFRELTDNVPAVFEICGTIDARKGDPAFLGRDKHRFDYPHGKYLSLVVDMTRGDYVPESLEDGYIRFRTL